MAENELRFLFSPSKKALVAARSSTGPAILFRQENYDWVMSPRNLSQIEGDVIYGGDDFENITYEKAKLIFKDINPDAYI